MKFSTKLLIITMISVLSPVALSQPHSGEMVFTNSARTISHNSISQNTSMEVQVDGLLVQVKVRQQFRNHSTEWMNGRYLFPLPESAAVNQYRLRVDERVIESEIHEKTKAKAIYQAAKANGQQAAIVNNQRANLFSTELANIAPGSTVETELVYYDQVRFEDNVFSLRLPTTLTPRFNGKQAKVITDPINDAHELSPLMTNTKLADRDNLTLQIDLNPGLQLGSVSSHTHSIEWYEQQQAYRINLQQGVDAMDRDFVLEWRAMPATSPTIATFVENYAGKHYLNLLVIPPQQKQTTATPRTVIFVIDTSGSMSGISILQARKSLQNALSRLTTNQHFNVIEFDDSARPFYSKPVLATADNIQRAVRKADNLQADGGTNIYAALSQAFAQPAIAETLKQIVFMTDGSVGDEQGLFTLIKDNIGADRLFTIGIGSAPNSHFMQKSAKYGRGTFTYIDQLNRVEEKMSALFNKLEHPVLQDLDIQWGNLGQVNMYPGLLPDLYHGQPIQITAELNQTGGELLITGRLGNQPWKKSITLPNDANSSGQHVLWAKAKVDSIMETRIDGALEEQIKPAVLELALAHNLVTPYTSMVAVDKTPVNNNPDNNLDGEVANLMPAGNTMQIHYPQTATNADQHILIAICLMILLFMRSLLRPTRSLP